MTLKEQNRVMEFLQSIASGAIGAQTMLDHTSKLDLLSTALDDIESDLKHIRRVVEAYIDPSEHRFKPSKNFGDCCAICGDVEAMHDGNEK